MPPDINDDFVVASYCFDFPHSPFSDFNVGMICEEVDILNKLGNPYGNGNSTLEVVDA